MLAGSFVEHTGTQMQRGRPRLRQPDASEPSADPCRRSIPDNAAAFDPTEFENSSFDFDERPMN